MTEEIEPQTNYTVKKFYTDKEYNELKQENEELKSKMIGETGFICDCTKVENYRSALEEIREIAKNSIINNRHLSLWGK